MGKRRGTKGEVLRVAGGLYRASTKAVKNPIPFHLLTDERKAVYLEAAREGLYDLYNTPESGEEEGEGG